MSTPLQPLEFHCHDTVALFPLKPIGKKQNYSAVLENSVAEVVAFLNTGSEYH